MIDAINETCKFSFPLDHYSLSNIEAGFRASIRHQYLKGYLEAIEGMVFSTKSPVNAINNPNVFCVDRKNKFVLLNLAACNCNQGSVHMFCLPENAHSSGDFRVMGKSFFTYPNRSPSGCLPTSTYPTELMFR